MVSEPHDFTIMVVRLATLRPSHAFLCVAVFFGISRGGFSILCIGIFREPYGEDVAGYIVIGDELSA